MAISNEGNCVFAGEEASPASDRKLATQLSIGVAASMLMASAASAQTTLPPLAVETKKAPAKAKAKAAPKAKQAPPPVAEAAPAGPVDPSTLPGSYTTSTASSASKQTAPLLNTPQTVSVIPSTIIEERQATTLGEALRNVPGISFNGGENGFGTGGANFQLRGFDSSANIFVDGVRDSGVYTRDMFNVDRIEVFKGPAADNGRGGAGGYINIVSKSPQLENFARAEVGVGWDEYDSEMRRRATFDVNQRFGTTAVRINGMIEDSGVAGRDLAEAKAWGFAPTIAFGLGTDTRAIFSYYRLDRNDRPDWGVPGAMVKGTINYNPIAGRASRDNFYGLRSDTDDATVDAVTARFEHDLAPGITISNQTRWSQVDRYSAYTWPGAFTAPNTVATIRNYYDRLGTNLTNQTEVTAKFWAGGFKHSLGAGIEIGREDSDSNRYANNLSSGSLPTNIFDPNPDRAAFGPPTLTQRAGIGIDTIAGYVYDTVDLTRQLQLTGGLRVERYSVSVDSKTAAGAPVGNFDGYNEDFTTLGGKIGLVYKPVQEGSLYASFGTSGMPPAGVLVSSPDISREGDNAFPGLVRGADPVQLYNYEIGMKWNFFGGRLTTSAALFRTEKQKVAITGCTVLVSSGTCAGNGGAETLGYGKQIVQGLELAVAGSLTERWKLFGGLGLIDSERQHSAELDALRRNANPGDYGSALRTSGDELAFTPRFTANFWSTYKVTDAFTLGAGFQYVSEAWLGRPDDALRLIPNGRFGKLPDYFVVNAMASYDVTDNITLRLNVDNVFDELYATSMNWAGVRGQLGNPRTYWLSASFKY
ncbi:TonB-dependent siderophore receptor [Hyphomicrobium sp. CS1BSMeth3]|uniref:TonB-dependent receptor n=1 Tax=Hyphomicrobium sp. CS1BSMeth3 TaxID=1892844 RepID=UPI0009F98B1F|nr:TonB-dependent siderophore receptor [Hyphomicrobium sp. CS1BSMeth3]